MPKFDVSFRAVYEGYVTIDAASSKETGALRRISMELTRALADLRRIK